MCVILAKQPACGELWASKQRYDNTCITVILGGGGTRRICSWARRESAFESNKGKGNEVMVKGATVLTASVTSSVHQEYKRVQTVTEQPLAMALHLGASDARDALDAAEHFKTAPLYALGTAPCELDCTAGTTAS